MKCRHMEDLASRLKQQFIEKIANPKKRSAEPLDIDALMKKHLA